MYSPEFLNYDNSSNLDAISNIFEIFDLQCIQEKELDTSSFESDRNLASSDFSESSISTFDLFFNNNKEERTKIHYDNKRLSYNELEF